MTKAGLVEEMMEDAMDSALGSEELEEESEQAVDAILMEIAGETLGQMAAAPRQQQQQQHVVRRGGGAGWGAGAGWGGVGMGGALGWGVQHGRSGGLHWRGRDIALAVLAMAHLLGPGGGATSAPTRNAPGKQPLPCPRCVGTASAGGGSRADRRGSRPGGAAGSSAVMRAVQSYREHASVRSAGGLPVGCPLSAPGFACVGRPAV